MVLLTVMLHPGHSQHHCLYPKAAAEALGMRLKTALLLQYAHLVRVWQSFRYSRVRSSQLPQHTCCPQSKEQCFQTSIWFRLIRFVNYVRVLKYLQPTLCRGRGLERAFCNTLRQSVQAAVHRGGGAEQNHNSCTLTAIQRSRQS